MPSEWYTPPQIAKTIGVKSAKILGWIRSGELTAINLGDGGRPRWRISTAAWNAFIQGRTSVPTIVVKSSRRRRVSEPSVIQFFK